MPESSRVAFLGLGVMGGPMAGHLAKAGHHVTVFNRTQTKSGHWAEEHRELHVGIARSPASAAENADLVFACVGNDQDLRNVTLGQDGAFASMKKEPSLSITPPPLPRLPGNWGGGRSKRHWIS